MNKLILDNERFKNLVGKICRDITLSGWRPDYIVGITRGGLWPAVMISQYFNIPCETIKVQLRDGTENSCESNLWMAEDAFGYTEREIVYYDGDPNFVAKPKKILIVDDINDTGATLNWIMKDWQDSCLRSNPRWANVWNGNVKFAAIVDNLASKCNVKMDYVGMEVNKAENDVWIEFPYEEWWSK
jgi:hypoxanthine phosphoribosyltransferase